ncbi:MAG: tellurite resistance TerB family protein [Planctomycetes bacterium]|jgi:uncharacterized tellurite resistance protein B-like protein|nr:tellurite resistance TerB family protein [Planctomycetota bacterium]
MGLLGKIFGTTPRKASDDQLLVYGMMLMVGADGDVQQEELATLNSFVITLPEFRGKDLREVFRGAQQTLKGKKSVEDAVAALAGIESPAVKKKLYVVAADLALSSGDIDEGEEKLLEQMQKVLGIDDALATKVVEVLALKYQR